MQQLIKCVNIKHSKLGGKLSNEFVKQLEFIFNVLLNKVNYQLIDYIIMN
jgi:hypothetical protein